MMMRKIRGFRIGRRLVKVFKWWVNRRLSGTSCAAKAISKICSWGRSLKNKAKWLSFLRKHSGCNRVGSEVMVEEKRVHGHVPKGHLAVYVGDGERDTSSRVLVPVIYFNHPLFAELLREAEMVFGFDHQGGIHIPCRKAQIEDVKKRIAATGGGGNGGGWSCIKV